MVIQDDLRLLYKMFHGGYAWWSVVVMQDNLRWLNKIVVIQEDGPWWLCKKMIHGGYTRWPMVIIQEDGPWWLYKKMIHGGYTR